MDVRLVVEKGKRRLRVHRLEARETVIGRRQDCDLRVPSAEVSRRHCLLSIEDGYLSVEDLDSVNGTFVNGTRVEGRQVVRPGDHLDIGPVRFVVEYELTQETLDRLEQGEPAPLALTEEADEVLPVAEEESSPSAFVFAEEDEPLDALPLPDEEPEMLTAHVEPPPIEEEAQELLPIDETEAAAWNLPDSNDLRNVLSNLDKEKPKSS